MEINIIPQKALELLPGVSRRLAGEIIMKRPFGAVEDVKRIAPSIPAEIVAVMRV
jgi:predicted nucleic acid-binding OB-fold protein